MSDPGSQNTCILATLSPLFLFLLLLLLCSALTNHLNKQIALVRIQRQQLVGQRRMQQRDGAVTGGNCLELLLAAFRLFLYRLCEVGGKWKNI